MERARRLRKGAEFDTAYREGTVVGGPLLVVRARRNGAEVTRWGFAVGKRIAPLATRRSRTKRVLREAVRTLNVEPGWDVIVTLRAGALAGRGGAMRDEVARALRKCGVGVES